MAPLPHEDAEKENTNATSHQQHHQGRPAGKADDVEVAAEGLAFVGVGPAKVTPGGHYSKEEGRHQIPNQKPTLLVLV
ncbi:MAG: hypothetical protein BZY88_01335 [SAR202 cluster bacterium Io17-Chloro-G9]|nr:MAG: hypothetical protein BZY88_01335 [SAR202 cluster bacterium Io17-Chloro-G9]